MEAVARGDSSRAIESFDRALAIKPDHAEAYYKRANELAKLGRFAEAVLSYEHAIEHKGDHAHAYCNLGTLQHKMGLQESALASYDMAIRLDPQDARAHYNRALLMQDYSRWDEVLASYDRAVAIDPRFADAQYNRALALLFQGNFGEGWSAYEWRWKNAQRLAIGHHRSYTQPLWLGEAPLKGKRLLLHSEGGLGDTIQFCRYAALCAARGAVVILEVQAPLLDLLGKLDGVAEWVTTGGALPPFDYHCPLMSLPLAFKTTLDSIPSARQYIQPDPVKVAGWRARLGESSRGRIGLVWSGNPNNRIDHQRSIRLADWVAHLPPAYEYYCLQRDVRAPDRAVLDANGLIRTFRDDLMDFSGTAALCECMDVVVSVDTSLAHLSGALGRPTWVLLPFDPDWRWLQHGDTSPWYPTMTLYRQDSSRDWRDVFARVAADLKRQLE